MKKEYRCKCGATFGDIIKKPVIFDAQFYDTHELFCDNCGFRTLAFLEIADLEEYLLENKGQILKYNEEVIVPAEDREGEIKYNYQTIGPMTIAQFADFWNNCPPEKWNICMGKVYVSQKDCYDCRLQWLWELVKEQR